MEKQTPLYQKHLEANGKIVPFAGFLLPVQYEKGIIYEHNLVRNQAGLFDVSHMGEFKLSGPNALATLNYILTNDYSDMLVNQVRYGILCYENGNVVDDLLVYKKANEDYLIVVNASNIDKDFMWINEHLLPDTSLTNISDQVAQVAIQGPKAQVIIAKLTNEIPHKNYTFIDNVKLNDINCLLSRTGYTGEDGFEIYCDPKYVNQLWDLLLKVGADEGLQPCGLGARDTLRLEAGMPLYGHELSDTINPIESNLGYFVKMHKDFIGKAALSQAPLRKRVGFELIERGIAREKALIYLDDKLVGYTTSGTYSPTLNKAIAMALLDDKMIFTDVDYQINVRNKMIKARLTPLPFYKRKKKEEQK